MLKSRRIYDGRVLDLRVDRIIEPGGIDATREVAGHPGSVVILPRLDDGRIILVRQYRYPAAKVLWELVAGGLEPGETPHAAARRELREETGYRARHVRSLLSFYPSPGILTERMFLVEALGLTPSEAQPEEDERIRVACFTPAELRRMVRARKIHDAKTLVGLMWFLGRFGPNR